MTVSEKVAYIQGMFDGMGLGKAASNEARILSEVLDVLKEIGEQLDGLDATLDSFGEELDAVSDDLSDVEAVVFEDDGDEDGCSCGHHHGAPHGPDGFDPEADEPIEEVCPNCGQRLVIDGSTLESGFICCPACGQKFALSVEEDGDESFKP